MQKMSFLKIILGTKKANVFVLGQKNIRIVIFRHIVIQISIDT